MTSHDTTLMSKISAALYPNLIPFYSKSDRLSGRHLTLHLTSACMCESNGFPIVGQSRGGGIAETKISEVAGQKRGSDNRVNQSAPLKT